MTKLFANSGDPDQTPRSAASDLGLHCLPSTLLWVSRLQWVKEAYVVVLIRSASKYQQHMFPWRSTKRIWIPIL